MHRHPWLELAVLIGLPLIVVLAGIALTLLSIEQGFTPLAETAVRGLPR